MTYPPSIGGSRRPNKTSKPKSSGGWWSGGGPEGGMEGQVREGEQDRDHGAVAGLNHGAEVGLDHGSVVDLDHGAVHSKNVGLFF